MSLLGMPRIQSSNHSVWAFFQDYVCRDQDEATFSNQYNARVFCFCLFLMVGGGGVEDLKQGPCPARSQRWGSISWPWDDDLSRNQESDAQPIEPPRHPHGVSYKRDKFPNSDIPWRLPESHCTCNIYLVPPWTIPTAPMDLGVLCNQCQPTGSSWYLLYYIEQSASFLT